jgi:hypothetical protein
MGTRVLIPLIPLIFALVFLAAVASGGCQAGVLMGLEVLERLPPDIRYEPTGPPPDAPHASTEEIAVLETEPDRPFGVIGSITWSYWEYCAFYRPVAPKPVRNASPDAVGRGPAVMARVLERVREAGGDALIVRMTEIDEACTKRIPGESPIMARARWNADVLRYSSNERRTIR